MSEISREDINKHMNRLRGKLFTLVESCIPNETQQDAVKRTIKIHTQATWRGLLVDAGFSVEHQREEQPIPCDGKESNG